MLANEKNFERTSLKPNVFRILMTFDYDGRTPAEPKGYYIYKK